MNTPVSSWLLLLMFLIPCGSVSAQDSEATFQANVLHKQRFLRDFNAEDEIKGAWIADKVQIDPPKVRTLGVFTADRYALKRNAIELVGKRQTLEKKSDTALALSPNGETVHIKIDLKGGDPATLLPRVEEALFFPTKDAAILALPTRYRDKVPAPADSKCCSKPSRPATPPCDCADAGTDRCQNPSSSLIPAGQKPPKVLRAVDPTVSDEALKAHYSSAVELGLVVNTKGTAEDLWITRSAGLGLDKEAAKSLSGYMFSPATCHDKPVPVDLFIDISFSSMP